MKDRALRLAEEASGTSKENVLREYVQAHILHTLQSTRAFEQLAFVGGTALRFLYGLRRYSEDLDFSMERSGDWNLESFTQVAVSDLTKAGFRVTDHLSTARTVQSVFIRFPGILYEAGLSPHPEEKLSIKLEIDTKPPVGAEEKTTVVNRHFLLALWHYDLPSLMAGKLHALLSRPYTKGRDIYDLFWYLTRPEKLHPNMTLLRNSLNQTDWKGSEVTSDNWRTILAEKLKELDWKDVLDDVGAFLEDPESRRLLALDNMLEALKQ